MYNTCKKIHVLLISLQGKLFLMYKLDRKKSREFLDKIKLIEIPIKLFIGFLFY